MPPVFSAFNLTEQTDWIECLANDVVVSAPLS